MDIPSEFICPITQEIMKEPVSDNEGVSYEKLSIERWLSRNNTSPMSRKPLYMRDLRPNIALKNLISSFNDKNKVPTEILTMREARLKRFDDSVQESAPLPQVPAPLPQVPEPLSIRYPDPIIQETLIPSGIEAIVRLFSRHSFNPTSEHIKIMMLRMSIGLLPTTRPLEPDFPEGFDLDSCPLDERGPRGGRNPYRLNPSDCDCWKCEDKREYDRRIRY